MILLDMNTVRSQLQLAKARISEAWNKIIAKERKCRWKERCLYMS